MRDQTQAEAIVLTSRGYAVHWLRQHSKMPVAEGWSTAPIADIQALHRTYRRGYNVGVRCGSYSRPAPGMGLVILDTDVWESSRRRLQFSRPLGFPLVRPRLDSGPPPRRGELLAPTEQT
jgi:Bifunctional DNA primase/polymerase, N-terminal